MNEVLRTVLMFLFGAGGLALINIIQERWRVRYQRKAEKEDRAEEREDKLDEIGKQLSEFIKKQDEVNEKNELRFSEMEKNDSAQVEALKYVLLDRIMYIGQGYINNGDVTFDERKRLREMHDVYHYQLGGNGDADQIMKSVDELPLRATKA